MNQLLKKIFILLLAFAAVGTVHAQKKNRKKTTTKKTAAPKKKESRPATQTVSIGDTAAPKTVTITSAFKPFLKDAAKVNFTAATPVIDSSKIPTSYSIPSQNLFFLYQPVAIKPLGLGIDSGYTWENNHYIKLGFGNFSSYFAQAAFSFGDGKTSITNVRGNFLTSTGHLYAQQAAKWGVDVLSIFNTKSGHEWTTRPYYESSTQYFYGYDTSLYHNYKKDDLLQRFVAVGIEVGMQNKTANAYGITYHPQISFARFFDNREAHENTFVIKAPIRKSLGEMYAIDLGITADISTATFPLIPNPLKIQNNLYWLDPSVQIKTGSFKVNAGIRPAWDNKQFSLLPNLSAEARITDLNIILEAGWVGSFQKTTYRSLAGFNPWVSTPFPYFNTKISEQYAGIKGTKGNHFTYQFRAAFQKLTNQPLFLNNSTDGKTFDVEFEPEMNALRLHGEIGYTEQERISFTAGATFNEYSSLQKNEKAWGLLPIEATASLKWKVLKDLQVKADAFIWDGAPYRDSVMGAKKGSAVADLNLGAEFTVMPRLNLWLQMNNVLNSTYQRWNQYSVLGFNVLGGVVYSFR